jgi:hypothetical protein
MTRRPLLGASVGRVGDGQGNEQGPVCEPARCCRSLLCLRWATKPVNWHTALLCFPRQYLEVRQYRRALACCPTDQAAADRIVYDVDRSADRAVSDQHSSADGVRDYVEKTTHRKRAPAGKRQLRAIVSLASKESWSKDFLVGDTT